MSKKKSSVLSIAPSKNKSSLVKGNICGVNRDLVVRQTSSRHSYNSRFSIKLDSIAPTIHGRIPHTGSTDSSSKSRQFIENLRAECKHRSHKKLELLKNMKDQLEQLLNLAENESEISRNTTKDYSRLEKENSRLSEEPSSLWDRNKDLVHLNIDTRRLMRANTDLSCVNLKDLNIFQPKKRKSHIEFNP